MKVIIDIWIAIFWAIIGIWVIIPLIASFSNWFTTRDRQYQSLEEGEYND